MGDAHQHKDSASSEKARPVRAAFRPCAVVGLATVWTGLPLLLVPTVCGALVAGTAWFLHRDLRLGRVGR